ncbi:uncharacterized protein [Panulirus ornatus]|uniref:uncharacterized protein n=1 Tax=Panulirus ornatus TaxID=150431 RepID=UPI003A883EE6
MTTISKNQVTIFLLLCWAIVDTGPVMAESSSDKNICAMTDVLVAMKELMIMLSSEIRDLKRQVHDSCQSNCRHQDLPANYTDPTSQEIDDLLEATNVTFTTIASLAHDNLTTMGLDTTITTDFDNVTTTTVEPDSDYGDYNDTDFENPLDSFVKGFAGFWEVISPFAPRPTEFTTEGTNATIEPSVTLVTDDDDKPTEASSGATKTTTTTTTTTTTELPYTLPPAPISCPNPFRLLAEGCYLIIHDARDWRTWGEAHSMCQSYGGGLAAPWRLSQLQDYLSRYYSDAFWVGARFNPLSRTWQWLSERKVEKSTWKLGQPSKNPGKKCVFLDKWSGYHANNFFCGEKYPFVCDYREV